MLSENNSRILIGSPVGAIPNCSLAEYLVPKLKSLPHKHIIQVEEETGAVQTSGELLQRAISLSEGLKRMGLKENDVVGMLCKNCIAADEIVLATWLSGAVISPVDGSMKLVEMKHILELTKPKFIFTEEESLSNIRSSLTLLSMNSTTLLVSKNKGSHSSQLTLEEVLLDVDTNGYEAQPVGSPSDQLVAILPSSGTSGLQKAVGITHRNLIFQDLNAALHKPFNLTTTFLQVSNFYWITGVLNFLRSLSTGMKRILLRTATTTNFLKAIQEHKPEWTLVGPLYLLTVTRDPEFDQYDVSSMKYILLGGYPFTPSMADQFKLKWSHVKFFQCYGATEVSGLVCDTDPDNGNIFALGKVTPGVQVKIVDTTTGELLKANSLGEIRVMSPGIMKCYVGNDEATRECTDAEGWIRTGDLGYYDDMEQLYLVDRIKEMIKVMNMQVAPVEIENAIISVPGVLEAGVTAVTNNENEQQIMALVVKEKNSSVTEDEVHLHIANTLSDYKKLTGGVHFLGSLPKTGSGKLRRSEMKKIAQELYSARKL